MGTFTGHSNLKEALEKLAITAVTLMIYDGYAVPTSIHNRLFFGANKKKHFKVSKRK